MNKPSDAKPYFAHSANSVGRWHPLKDHLTAVAKLTEEHAGTAPWANEAALAGLLHDLGKYADRFQVRLEGKDSGLDPRPSSSRVLVFARYIGCCKVHLCLGVSGNSLSSLRV